VGKVIEKGHGNNLLIAAMSRKKGAKITPPEIQFFKKENGGFDLSQNRRSATLPIFGRKIATATTAVFFITAGQAPFFL